MALKNQIVSVAIPLKIEFSMVNNVVAKKLIMKVINNVNCVMKHYNFV